MLFSKVISAALCISSVAAVATPAGCKKLPGDDEWPTKEILDQELPGWEARMNMDKNSTDKHPNWVYDVKTVESVQKAVKFAAKHNVRISVINSGHDFIGRNDAPSGLLLSVKKMKGVRVLPEWVPTEKGAEPVTYKTRTNLIKYDPTKQAAVTFGPGMSYAELKAEMGRSGLWTVGAGHEEVSVAGGWSQAGGHGALSSHFGLGCDNVLEFKVVTPDGELRVANEVSNPDLFWALRGGGASTFGVVVEATFKAYPVPKMYFYTWYINTTDYEDRKSVFAPAAYLHTQMPLMNQNGLQGYLYVHKNALRANLYAANEFANVSRMHAVMDPILKKIASFPGMNASSLFTVPPVDYAAINFGALLGAPKGAKTAEGGQPGPKVSPVAATAAAPPPPPPKLQRRHGPGEEKSTIPMSMGIYNQDARFLTEEHLTSPDLAQVLEEIMPFDQIDGMLRQHLVIGPRVWASGNGTSAHPAWRKSYVHSISTGVGNANITALRRLAADTGAYVNEAWVGNPNWKDTYWGTNYPRLSEIKSKYDPNMVFYVTPGINADHMVYSKESGRLCKVEGAAPKTVDDSAPEGDNHNQINFHGRYLAPVFPRLYMGKNKPVMMNLGNLFDLKG